MYQHLMLMLDQHFLTLLALSFNCSTSSPDPITIFFSKSVLNCLSKDIVNIVNGLLQSGIFPGSLKSLTFEEGHSRPTCYQ